MDTNQWHHLAVTIDNSSVKFYVDSKVDSESSSNGQFEASSHPLFIGLAADSKKAMKGKIDDVRMYDRALSAAEIQALYNLGQ
jgi:hypothetical protein